MLLAGTLDRKINIRRPTAAPSDAGEATASGTYLAQNVWASARTPKGRELQSGGRDGSIAEKVFRIRQLAGVTESMIVEFDSADWRIIYVDDTIGRGEMLELYTQKVR